MRHKWPRGASVPVEGLNCHILVTNLLILLDWRLR
jgi:hypothetical protein